MKEHISISRWIDAYQDGLFASKDVKVQIDAGWWDWFCSDKALAGKTDRLGKVIQGVKAGGKVNLTNWYVWFKNNCPLNGPLYDDFRFADLETGDVQFTVQVDCCWNKKKYTVYGRTPDGKFHSDEPLFETDSSVELKKWLNSPWES